MGTFSVVTGAFGFTGRYIAQRLLDEGQSVKTLTRRRRPAHSFRNHIAVAPLDFADGEGLVRELRGASTLYNTYWVRFPRGGVTFEEAVANTKRLVAAAAEAGVGRLVHISVTNPSPMSPLPYFRGKALAEAAVSTSGLSYAIVRPSLIFGREDILLNNIAWLLQRLPVFGIPGSGRYLVQPVSVDDVADLAVAAGARSDVLVQDAVGPETYTFDALIRLIAGAVHSRARILHMNPGLSLVVAQVIGSVVNDVLLTRDELRGLMAGLLGSADPPTGTRRFSAWLADDAAALGREYASELGRHYR